MLLKFLQNENRKYHSKTDELFVTRKDWDSFNWRIWPFILMRKITTSTTFLCAYLFLFQAGGNEKESVYCKDEQCEMKQIFWMWIPLDEYFL